MPREIFLNQKGNELMFGGKSEGEEVVRGKHSHVQQAGGTKNTWKHCLLFGFHTLAYADPS